MQALQGPLKSFKKKSQKEIKKMPHPVYTGGGLRPASDGRLPATAGRPVRGRPMVGAQSAAFDQQSLTALAQVIFYPTPLPPPSYLFAPKFFHMWSILPHWFQHMPALPRLLLKTSNTQS
jgi:hypothetical protein